MRRRAKFCERQQWRQRVCDIGGVHRSGRPFVALLLLAGCSLGPVIAENTLDYNTTVETVTNNVLVTNILRARDQAPLYFSDLSQIRGAVQLNLAAQTTVPYGPIFPAGAGASVQPGPFSVNSQPGFDVAPLNTKKFAEGMLEGIDPRVFAYLVQRGINANLLLNMIVYKIERHHDNQYDTCLVDEPNDPTCRHLISSWTGKSQPFMGVVSSDAPIGPLIPAQTLADEENTLRNLIQANAADLDLNAVKITNADRKLNPKLPAVEKAYQLVKSSDKFVLCVRSGLDPATHSPIFDAVGIAVTGAAKGPQKPPVPANNGTCGKRSHNPFKYVIYTRSVQSIFYYLGGLLRHPEHASIPFYIFDHPVENVRFHTNYRGATYYVRELSPDDGTISILAILNDLLNLNRDANEIPSTKTVATAP